MTELINPSPLVFGRKDVSVRKVREAYTRTNSYVCMLQLHDSILTWFGHVCAGANNSG